MTVETNKALLRRFVEEIVNQGHMSIAAELVAEDFRELDPFPGQALGRAELIESIKRLRTAFPDLAWSIEELVAEGEKVASSHIWSGTHLGEFLGIAPTGPRVAQRVLSQQQFGLRGSFSAFLFRKDREMYDPLSEKSASIERNYEAASAECTSRC